MPSELEELDKEYELLLAGRHPVYLAEMAKMDKTAMEHKERNRIAYELDVQRIEAAYQLELNAIEKEADEQLSKLLDEMLEECEKQRRRVESDVIALEIGKMTHADAAKKTLRGFGKGAELWPMSGRVSAAPPPRQTEYLLNEAAIAADVRAVLGNKSPAKARVRDAQLHKHKFVFDGKTFKVGEEVVVENREYGKMPSKIESASESVVVFRSTLSWDTRQVFASSSDFQEGRVTVHKKRSG